MESTIFSFFSSLIKGDGIKNEESSFLRLKNGQRFVKYDPEEKRMYLWRWITDKYGGVIEDPSQDPVSVTFYEKLKQKVLESEKIAKTKIISGFESREYNKDRKVYLNYLHGKCSDLIRCYQEAGEDSNLADHPVIIEALKRIKEAIHDLYDVSGLSIPKEKTSSNSFERPIYKVKDVSQDEVVVVVNELLKQPRFQYNNGKPKPTTISNAILASDLVTNSNLISDRAFFDRVKDAIDEIKFHEAKSTS